jgi:hypothetical protein
LKPRIFKVVKVTWRDIVDDHNEWHHGDFQLEPVTVVTVGMIWRKTKAQITLVRDVYWSGTEYVTGGRVVIPTGVIVGIDELDEVDLNASQ